MPIAVTIVEDDAGFRAGLSRMIKGAPDFRWLGAYPDAETALERITADKPDVVLMDINLPGMSGLEFVRKLKARNVAASVVMLTVHDNPDYIFEALAAGATGYLLKATPPAEVLDAIRDVNEGGAPMTSQIARKVVDFFQHKAPVGCDAALTARQNEILRHLARGYLVKEIADEIGISFATVRAHIRHIYEILQVHSRAQAVAYYHKSESPARL